jgi:hypothetical protein
MIIAVPRTRVKVSLWRPPFVVVGVYICLFTLVLCLNELYLQVRISLHIVYHVQYIMCM